LLNKGKGNSGKQALSLIGKKNIPLNLSALSYTAGGMVDSPNGAARDSDFAA